MLSEHDFITPDECSSVREKIHALRAEWVNRAGGFLPFFTLGAVSYLDAPLGNEKAYRAKAEVQNKLLISQFSFLYERLVERLSVILQMPVAYADGLALPGFHIFLAHKSFEIPLATKHFDLQYEELTWDYQQVNKNQLFSFTCAVAVPSSSTGLNYWSVTHEDKKKMSKEEFFALTLPQHAQFMPYQLGKLILHQGLVLHQIAPGKDIQPNDERITLQGHGLICDGILRLYW